MLWVIAAVAVAAPLVSNGACAAYQAGVLEDAAREPAEADGIMDPEWPVLVPGQVRRPIPLRFAVAKDHRLFVLRGGELIVVDAREGAAPRVLDRRWLPGSPVGLFVHGAQLVVVAKGGFGGEAGGPPSPMEGVLVYRYALPASGIPVEVRRDDVAGALANLWRTGDHLTLVLDGTLQPAAVSRAAGADTPKAAIARLARATGVVAYRTSTPTEDQRGFVAPCGALLHEPGASGAGLVALVSLDLAHPDAAPVGAGLVGRTWDLTLTEDGLYAMKVDPTGDPMGTNSKLYRFAHDPVAGTLQFVAAGDLGRNVVMPYAWLDAHDGVATAAGMSYDIDKSVTTLQAFQDDGRGALKESGRSELARNGWRPIQRAGSFLVVNDGAGLRVIDPKLPGATVGRLDLENIVALEFPSAERWAAVTHDATGVRVHRIDAKDPAALSLVGTALLPGETQSPSERGWGALEAKFTSSRGEWAVPAGTGLWFVAAKPDAPIVALGRLSHAELAHEACYAEHGAEACDGPGNQVRSYLENATVRDAFVIDGAWWTVSNYGVRVSDRGSPLRVVAQVGF
jgi:hypothetical protein